MKNSEIVNGLNGLIFLAESGKEFPVKVSYAIAKNLRTLRDAYAIYEVEMKKITNNIEDATDEQKKEAEEKLQELLAIENDDVKIHKVTYEDLQGCGNMSVKEMTSIEFMMEED